MPRPGRGNEALPAVGLVLQDGSLGATIGKVLKASSFPIAFKVDLATRDNPTAEADVLVVAGKERALGDSLLRQIRARLLEARLVACIPHGNVPSIQWMIDRGVDGVVWNTRIPETLAPTIQAVHAGQLVVPMDLPRRALPPEFTNREKQALSLMIMGLTNREIAGKLFVSENTIKSHLNTAYRKLGVHSRAQAMSMITDPEKGLGTGILAITSPGLKRSREP